MKYLIFSDCHWSTYTSIVRGRGKEFSTRLEYLINSLNWVNQVAVEQSCGAMICAGDFMDKAQCTDEELTALRKIEWNDLDCFFVCGNHESSVNDLRFSSIKALESKNHYIIDKPKVFSDLNCNIILLPYIIETDRKPLKEYIEQFDLSTAFNIIISHNDIAGINYAGFESKEGFSIKEIEENCTLYLNGHLHNSEWITPKILNVGSFSAHNFTNNSLRYKYGIWILDTTTRKLEFIENPYSLQFYKFEILDKNDLKQLDIIKNNAVVSIRYLDTYENEIKNFIEKNKDKLIETRFVIAKSVENPNAETITAPIISSDYFEKFADFCKTNIQADASVLNAELAELLK